jgi:hypothetical protein
LFELSLGQPARFELLQTADDLAFSYTMGGPVWTDDILAPSAYPQLFLFAAKLEGSALKSPSRHRVLLMAVGICRGDPTILEWDHAVISVTSRTDIGFAQPNLDGSGHASGIPP